MLEHCMLALDRMYADAAGTVTTRVRQEVPLGHVDPRSLSVQQRPPAGPSALSMKTEPWRVVLSLRDGSIRTDFDRLGRRFTTYCCR
jgi:hypothetical protein